MSDRPRLPCATEADSDRVDRWIQPVVYDQLVEFVWGIDYETNLTGAVNVWTRQPGGTWSLKVDLTGVKTHQLLDRLPEHLPERRSDPLRRSPGRLDDRPVRSVAMPASHHRLLPGLPAVRIRGRRALRALGWAITGWSRHSGSSFWS